MKKMFKHKRQMAALLAGILVVVAIIGAGTYAWFTSQANIGGAEFTTGTVELADGVGDFGVYEFYTANPVNIATQTALEGTFSWNQANRNAALAVFLQSVNPADFLVGPDYDGKVADIDALQAIVDALLADFEDARNEWNDAWDAYLAALAEYDLLNDNPPDINDYLPDRADFPAGPVGTAQYWVAYGIAQVQFYAIVMPTYNVDLLLATNNLNLAEDEEVRLKGLRDLAFLAWQAQNDALTALLTELLGYGAYIEGDPDAVTPGSFIYGKFELDNTSNIETYFRVDGDPNEIFDNGFDNGSFVRAAVAIFGNGKILNLTEDVDGKFYCPDRLAAEEDVVIIVGAYIYGARNNDRAKLVEFGFSDMNVDLIQASNNAAELSWRVAGSTLPAGFWK